MPKYVVSFRRSAEKEFGRLDATVQKRVMRAVEGLAADPRPSGCRKLVGGEGDYRVIYTIDDVILIVAVESVRHRKDVYRPRN